MRYTLLELVPKHKVYIEPFCGGATLYWALGSIKQAPFNAVINDMHNRLIDSYRVIKNKELYAQLQEQISYSLHSRSLYNKALEIYNEWNADSVTCAWALIYLGVTSFFSVIGSGYYYENSTQNESRLKHINKTKRLRTKYETSYFTDYMEYTEIEHIDGTTLIKQRDTENVFFYIDPPYINTEQGHYADFSENDYQVLLDTLSTIKGKFLLSSFPNHIIDKAITEHGWHVISIEKKRTTSSMNKNGRDTKIELLVHNYELENHQQDLFD